MLEFVLELLCDFLDRYFYFKYDLECRGRDLNPRRPTPIGPEPIPFDRSGTPANGLYFKNIRSLFYV